MSARPIPHCHDDTLDVLSGDLVNRQDVNVPASRKRQQEIGGILTGLTINKTSLALCRRHRENQRQSAGNYRM